MQNRTLGYINYQPACCYTYMYSYTVDREIFVVTREILCMTNIFNVKHFVAT